MAFIFIINCFFCFRVEDMLGHYYISTHFFGWAGTFLSRQPFSLGPEAGDEAG